MNPANAAFKGGLRSRYLVSHDISRFERWDAARLQRGPMMMMRGGQTNPPRRMRMFNQCRTSHRHATVIYPTSVPFSL
jgi:hypothetical protein